jgi:hypothetical protein
MSHLSLDLQEGSSRGGDGQPRRRRGDGKHEYGFVLLIFRCSWYIHEIDCDFWEIVRWIFVRCEWIVNLVSKICCESCNLWDVYEFYLIVRYMICIRGCMFCDWEWVVRDLDWEWEKKIRERKENKGKKERKWRRWERQRLTAPPTYILGWDSTQYKCARYLTRYKCSTTFVSDALYRFNTRYKWGLWTGTNVCFSNSVQTPRWIQCHSMSCGPCDMSEGSDDESNASAQHDGCVCI